MRIRTHKRTFKTVCDRAQQKGQVVCVCVCVGGAGEGVLLARAQRNMSQLSRNRGEAIAFSLCPWWFLGLQKWACLLCQGWLDQVCSGGVGAVCLPTGRAATLPPRGSCA